MKMTLMEFSCAGCPNGNEVRFELGMKSTRELPVPQQPPVPGSARTLAEDLRDDLEHWLICRGWDYETDSNGVITKWTCGDCMNDAAYARLAEKTKGRSPSPASSPRQNLEGPSRARGVRRASAKPQKESTRGPDRLHLR